MDLLSIIAALLLLFVILLVIYVIYMSWDHGVFKKMGIPAPTPLPLFGNFFDVLKLGPFNHQEEEYQRYNRQKVDTQFMPLVKQSKLWGKLEVQ